MDPAIKNELLTVLKHFTLKELYENVLNEFPEIVWDDVRQYLKVDKKIASRTEVCKIIVGLAENLQLSHDELYSIIENLQLLADTIASKKTWIAFKLFDHSHRIPSTSHEIYKKLISAFRESNIQVKLNVINLKDGKFAISISKQTSPKKKKTEPHYFKPVFFIFAPPMHFFFSNKGTLPDNFLDAFSKGLGFRNSKQVKLSGKNVDDLLKLLRFKEKNKEKLEFESVEFEPQVRETSLGTDFTRRRDRARYADNLYGEAAPELQSLIFKVEDFPWKSDVMAGKTFSSQLEFTSPDVMKMIKDGIADGFIDTPVPEYLQNVLKLGKNVFNAKYEG